MMASVATTVESVAPETEHGPPAIPDFEIVPRFGLVLAAIVLVALVVTVAVTMCMPSAATDVSRTVSGAVGGLTLEGLPLMSYPAIAQGSAIQATQPSGPASFADVVDHVKGAVVSVKVTMRDAAQDDQSSGPDMSPGSPLDRFFQRR